MKTNTGTNYCKTLGSIAFAQGKPCVPALDGDLNQHIAGRKIGDSRTISELNAWLSGWRQASLA